MPLCLPARGYGEGWSFDDARSDWGNFALGFGAGYLGHELGHYVVATSKGYKVGHDGVSLIYSGPPFTNADHLQIASAGFQSQWLLTELVFRDSNGKEIRAAPGKKVWAIKLKR